MNAPDYAFYSQTYKGRMAADDFAAIVGGAKAHVDYLIGWKDGAEAFELQYKRAICAACDKLHEIGDGAGGGFAIGTFRMDDAAGKVDGRQAARQAIIEELGETGLLFGGLPC